MSKKIKKHIRKAKETRDAETPAPDISERKLQLEIKPVPVKVSAGTVTVIERLVPGQKFEIEDKLVRAQGTFLSCNDCSAKVRYVGDSQAIWISPQTPVRVIELLRTEVPLEAALECSEPVTEYAPKAKRKLLYGFPITAVIRHMGVECWSFREAKQVLADLDAVVADATIKIQLSAGVKGQRGEPANLTEEQTEELYSKISKK